MTKNGKRILKNLVSIGYFSTSLPCNLGFLFIYFYLKVDSWHTFQSGSKSKKKSKKPKITPAFNPPKQKPETR